jgi:hypothetical protein
MQSEVDGIRAWRHYRKGGDSQISLGSAVLEVPRDLYARKTRSMAEVSKLSHAGGYIVGYVDRVPVEDLSLSESMPLLCHAIVQGLDRVMLRTCALLLSTICMLRNKDVDLDQLCSALRDMLVFIPGGGREDVLAMHGEALD